MHVDISDEPVKKGICTNRNKFILGPSGSGKSFFTNHMVRSYYEQGTHIVLVDVGHSYKGLCDMVGGYYFTYDEKNPICFNPFYIGEGDSLDSTKNLDQVFMVINSFQMQMSDAKRLEIINTAADGIDENYNDLKAFNQQGILLSLQRAKAKNDVDAVKRLYGLQ